jgi:hypothetical protein
VPHRPDGIFIAHPDGKVNNFFSVLSKKLFPLRRKEGMKRSGPLDGEGSKRRKAMSMSTVWVANQPMPGANGFYDICLAEDFGQIEVLSRGKLSGTEGAQALTKIRRTMEREAQDGDYILCIGDITALLTAAMVMVERFGECRLLRWSRIERAYMMHRIVWGQSEIALNEGEAA